MLDFATLLGMRACFLGKVTVADWTAIDLMTFGVVRARSISQQTQENQAVQVSFEFQ